MHIIDKQRREIIMNDFVRVAEIKDIQLSKMHAIEANGEKVCLANVEGKFYAQAMFVLILVVLQPKANWKVMKFNVHGNQTSKVDGTLWKVKVQKILLSKTKRRIVGKIKPQATKNPCGMLTYSSQSSLQN